MQDFPIADIPENPAQVLVLEKNNTCRVGRTVAAKIKRKFSPSRNDRTGRYALYHTCALASPPRG